MSAKQIADTFAYHERTLKYIFDTNRKFSDHKIELPPNFDYLLILDLVTSSQTQLMYSHIRSSFVGEKNNSITSEVIY